jgi:hypothetical protein
MNMEQIKAAFDVRHRMDEAERGGAAALASHLQGEFDEACRKAGFPRCACDACGRRRAGAKRSGTREADPSPPDGAASPADAPDAATAKIGGQAQELIRKGNAMRSILRDAFALLGFGPFDAETATTTAIELAAEQFSEFVEDRMNSKAEPAEVEVDDDDSSGVDISGEAFREYWSPGEDGAPALLARIEEPLMLRDMGDEHLILGADGVVTVVAVQVGLTMRYGSIDPENPFAD